MKIYTRYSRCCPVPACRLPYPEGHGLIDPRVNTSWIDIFETVANNAPPTIGVDFTGTAFERKMRFETRLQLKTSRTRMCFFG
ncbi:MAG: hypothetical protein IPK76_24205 [Lewinellaceae bacterium]|nr:hypothetical protein [Lewinellaceae bacterium]